MQLGNTMFTTRIREFLPTQNTAVWYIASALPNHLPKPLHPYVIIENACLCLQGLSQMTQLITRGPAPGDPHKRVCPVSGQTHVITSNIPIHSFSVDLLKMPHHTGVLATLPWTLEFTSYASPPTIVSATVIIRGCRSSTPTGIPALPAPTPSTFFFFRGSESNHSGQRSDSGVAVTYSNNTEIGVGVTSFNLMRT